MSCNQVRKLAQDTLPLLNRNAGDIDPVTKALWERLIVQHRDFSMLISVLGANRETSMQVISSLDACSQTALIQAAAESDQEVLPTIRDFLLSSERAEVRRAALVQWFDAQVARGYAGLASVGQDIAQMDDEQRQTVWFHLVQHAYTLDSLSEHRAQKLAEHPGLSAAILRLMLAPLSEAELQTPEMKVAIGLVDERLIPQATRLHILALAEDEPAERKHVTRVWDWAQVSDKEVEILWGLSSPQRAIFAMINHLRRGRGRAELVQSVFDTLCRDKPAPSKDIQRFAQACAMHPRVPSDILCHLIEGEQWAGFVRSSAVLNPRLDTLSTEYAQAHTLPVYIRARARFRQRTEGGAEPLYPKPGAVYSVWVRGRKTENVSLFPDDLHIGIDLRVLHRTFTALAPEWARDIFSDLEKLRLDEGVVERMICRSANIGVSATIKGHYMCFAGADDVSGIIELNIDEYWHAILG